MFGMTKEPFVRYVPVKSELTDKEIEEDNTFVRNVPEAIYMHIMP